MVWLRGEFGGCDSSEDSAIFPCRINHLLSECILAGNKQISSTLQRLCNGKNVDDEPFDEVLAERLAY